MTETAEVVAFDDLPQLTNKREGFALDHLAGMTAADAYRNNYSTENMQPQTIHRRAHDVLTDGKVQARIRWEKSNKDAKRLEIEEIARKSASQALQTLVSISNDPKAPQSSRVAASCAVLDRAYGKPISKTELDATVNSRSGGVEEQSDEALLKVIQGGKTD